VTLVLNITVDDLVKEPHHVGEAIGRFKNMEARYELDKAKMKEVVE
jgi:hypothetical protein